MATKVSLKVLLQRARSGENI